MAYSILHARGEAWCPANMAYLIAKGRVSPMDLSTVESSTQKLYSFLSTEWAMAADIDLTSEKYRCCGNFRFTCRAFELLFFDGCVRKYSGTLHYLPVARCKGKGVLGEGVGGTLHDHSTLLPPLDQPFGPEHREAGWESITGDDFQYFWAMR
jgi:hypothetical protein